VLSEMRIQGVGVIDDALLELHPGFTVVTGETGAGKTMVVTGLHLLSGGRADASRVRAGAQKAVVEGRFDLTTVPQAAAIAEEAGAETDDDGSLIAVRSVSKDGRSRAHLGGRSVPAGALAQLAEHLIAVHGQNDQLRLLRPAEQLAVLDRYAGESVAEPLAAYQRVRAEWQAVVAELAERTTKSRELAQQADMLRHALTEIGAVDPQPGEDAQIAAEVKRLAEADELRSAAHGAQRALSGAEDGDPDQPGALGLIGEAKRRLEATGDPALTELASRLDQALVVLTDVGGELGAYLDDLDADPQRLEGLLARQAELKKLIRKYAADVDGVLAWAEEARRKLASLDTSDEALAELAARRDELAHELAGHAARLTKARCAAAEEMGAAITAELAGLAMGQAEVQISVRRRTATADDPAALEVDGVLCHAAEHGTDDVELLLKPHEGAPPLPVHKGASGGELSRVMLAIEVVVAKADPVPTMVFDEVDAGVGGRAAVEIGRRLARLARTHQVLVVTHLPQVAAYADRHLAVRKGTSGGVTASDVRTLSDSERVAELARMLAGMDDTETGLAHAEELLEVAAEDKAKLT